MANLEPSGSRIPHTWSVKVTFSLKVTFYLTKAENRTKNPNTAFTLLSLKVPFLPKMLIFCKKNADISKTKKALISIIILTGFRQGVIPPHPPHTHTHTETWKQTPKKPTRIRVNKHTLIKKWLVLTTQLNHFASLAKWLSVHLWTEWLWVRVQLQSLKLQILRLLRARSSLTFRQMQSVDSLWNVYLAWQEHTVKCTVHISTHNIAQSFGQYG